VCGPGGVQGSAEVVRAGELDFAVVVPAFRRRLCRLPVAVHRHVCSFRVEETLRRSSAKVCRGNAVGPPRAPRPCPRLYPINYHGGTEPVKKKTVARPPPARRPANPLAFRSAAAYAILCDPSVPSGRRAGGGFHFLPPGAPHAPYPPPEEHEPARRRPCRAARPAVAGARCPPARRRVAVSRHLENDHPLSRLGPQPLPGEDH